MTRDKYYEWVLEEVDEEGVFYVEKVVVICKSVGE